MASCACSTIFDTRCFSGDGAPGAMGALSAPLNALADLLYVGADLIAVAAVRSQPVNHRAAREQFGQWIAGLPEPEKTALLSGSAAEAKSRTVAVLLDEVERRERQRGARAGRREPQARSA